MGRGRRGGGRRRAGRGGRRRRAPGRLEPGRHGAGAAGAGAAGAEAAGVIGVEAGGVAGGAGGRGGGAPAVEDGPVELATRVGVAAGCSDAGRLVMRRVPVRLAGGAGAGPVGRHRHRPSGRAASPPPAPDQSPDLRPTPGRRPPAWLLSSWRTASGRPAPRAGPAGEGPPGPPSDGRGRPARPRWTTSGSSRPSRGRGRGRAPPCWSVPARGRARRPGSSSATPVTALHSRRSAGTHIRPSILAHHGAEPSEPLPTPPAGE